jgi:hypothetical protein
VATVTPPPPGAELAYDVLSSQVIRQLSDAESLDTKLGVAVAVLVTLAGAIYAANPPPAAAAVVAGWIFVALIQAVRGFTYDTGFAEGVSAKFLEDRLRLDAVNIKWHSIEPLKAAQRANRKRLDRKGRLLSQVTATVGVIAALGLLGKMLGVS